MVKVCWAAAEKKHEDEDNTVQETDVERLVTPSAHVRPDLVALGQPPVSIGPVYR